MATRVHGREGNHRGMGYSSSISGTLRGMMRRRPGRRTSFFITFFNFPPTIGLEYYGRALAVWNEKQDGFGVLAGGVLRLLWDFCIDYQRS